MPLPRAADRKDPVNRVFALVAIIGACVMVPLVVFVQQFLIQLRETTLDRPLDSMTQNEEATDPGISAFTLTAISLVKSLYFQAEESGVKPHMVPRDQLNEDDEPLLWPIEQLVITRTDRLRFGIVVAEVHGAAHGRQILAQLAGEATPGGDIATDIGWLNQLYAENPAPIPDAARTWLASRHGWFGRLALSYGRPLEDAERRVLVGGFERVVAVLALLVIWLFIVGIAGLIFLIVSLVFFFRGDLTGSFDAPAVGGSVYLETFVIFLIAFMALLLVSIPFRGASTTGAAVGLGISEALQWGLLAALLWPVARGVSRNALCVDLGLHTGEGWLKEIGCGIGGFLTDVGLTGVLMILTGLLGAAFGGDEGAVEGDPSGFPMFEEPLSNSWVVLWIAAIGAVIWAPVYEEIVFRGCLYRYLHGKLNWFGAATISALIFGAIHPYDIPGLLSVAMGGFIYALLREWRGSLIAPMVAHCLHNLQITLIQLGFIKAITFGA